MQTHLWQCPTVPSESHHPNMAVAMGAVVAVAAAPAAITQLAFLEGFDVHLMPVRLPTLQQRLSPLTLPEVTGLHAPPPPQEQVSCARAHPEAPGALLSSC